MPTGTDGGLLDSPKPQSVYKHGILEQYVIRFATMTACKLNPKRAVLFDGFAGRGRFDTGEAGSAEHMMIAAQKGQGDDPDRSAPSGEGPRGLREPGQGRR